MVDVWENLSHFRWTLHLLGRHGSMTEGNNFCLRAPTVAWPVEPILSCWSVSQGKGDKIVTIVWPLLSTPLKNDIMVDDGWCFPSKMDLLRPTKASLHWPPNKPGCVYFILFCVPDDHAHNIEYAIMNS